MNLFDFYVPEEILVALSLLILVFVMAKFFWKPIMKIIDERRKAVDDMLKSAEDAKTQVSQMDERRLNQNAELDKLILDKTNEARESAGREYNRIIDEAEKKAHDIIRAAEDKAQREHQQMLVRSRDAIISLAMGAASKLVESSMDNEKNRGLIDAMLRDAGVPNE